jgi:hypothetical protein
MIVYELGSAVRQVAALKVTRRTFKVASKATADPVTSNGLAAGRVKSCRVKCPSPRAGTSARPDTQSILLGVHISIPLAVLGPASALLTSARSAPASKVILKALSTAAFASLR